MRLNSDPISSIPTDAVLRGIVIPDVVACWVVVARVVVAVDVRRFGFCRVGLISIFLG